MGAKSARAKAADINHWSFTPGPSSEIWAISKTAKSGWHSLWEHVSTGSGGKTALRMAKSWTSWKRLFGCNDADNHDDVPSVKQLVLEKRTKNSGFIKNGLKKNKDWSLQPWHFDRYLAYFCGTPISSRKKYLPGLQINNGYPKEAMKAKVFI